MDYRRSGQTIKGLINVARNGYIWFLERGSGPIRFVEGKPFVFQNVFRSLDPVTGRPDIDPERKPMTGKRADFCPGVHGGKNWPPIAFSPRTRLICIPANNNLCARTWACSRNTRGMQATLNNLLHGEYPEVPEGGAIWVFALE